jgi:hypothetical protein
VKLVDYDESDEEQADEEQVDDDDDYEDDGDEDEEESDDDADKGAPTKSAKYPPTRGKKRVALKKGLWRIRGAVFRVSLVLFCLMSCKYLPASNVYYCYNLVLATFVCLYVF